MRSCTGYLGGGSRFPMPQTSGRTDPVSGKPPYHLDATRKGDEEDELDEG